MRKSAIHGLIVLIAFMLVNVSLRGAEIAKEKTNDKNAVKECLKQGDILLSINGTQVSNPADSMTAFKLLHAEGEKTVKVFRDKKEVTLKCKFE